MGTKHDTPQPEGSGEALRINKSNLGTHTYGSDCLFAQQAIVINDPSQMAAWPRRAPLDANETAISEHQRGLMLTDERQETMTVAVAMTNPHADLNARLRGTPLYEGSGEESDLPDYAADALESLAESGANRRILATLDERQDTMEERPAFTTGYEEVQGPLSQAQVVLSEIVEWAHRQMGTYPDWIDRARKQIGQFTGDLVEPTTSSGAGDLVSREAVAALGAALQYLRGEYPSVVSGGHRNRDLRNRISWVLNGCKGPLRTLAGEGGE